MGNPLGGYSIGGGNNMLGGALQGLVQNAGQNVQNNGPNGAPGSAYQQNPYAPGAWGPNNQGPSIFGTGQYNYQGTLINQGAITGNPTYGADQNYGLNGVWQQMQNEINAAGGQGAGMAGGIGLQAAPQAQAAMGNAALTGYAGIGTAGDQQFANQQQNLANILGTQAAGGGTSAADLQLQHGMQQSIAAQQAMLGSQRGSSGSYALDTRQAADAAAAAQAQTNQAMGLQRAQETANAQQALGGVLQGARGQGQAYNFNQAQLQQQAMLANQGAANQFGLANMGNAQQASLANQALAGQYGLQQGTMNQQTMLANQGAQLSNAQLYQNELNAMLGGMAGLGGQSQQAALANQQLLQQQALGMNQVQSGAYANAANANANTTGAVVGGLGGLAALGLLAFSDENLKTGIQGGNPMLDSYLRMLRKANPEAAAQENSTRALAAQLSTVGGQMGSGAANPYAGAVKSLNTAMAAAFGGPPQAPGATPTPGLTTPAPMPMPGASDSGSSAGVGGMGNAYSPPAASVDNAGLSGPFDALSDKDAKEEAYAQGAQDQAVSSAGAGQGAGQQVVSGALPPWSPSGGGGGVPGYGTPGPTYAPPPPTGGGAPTMVSVSPPVGPPTTTGSLIPGKTPPNFGNWAQGVGPLLGPTPSPTLQAAQNPGGYSVNPPWATVPSAPPPSFPYASTPIVQPRFPIGPMSAVSDERAKERARTEGFRQGVESIAPPPGRELERAWDASVKNNPAFSPAQAAHLGDVYVQSSPELAARMSPPAPQLPLPPLPAQMPQPALPAMSYGERLAGGPLGAAQSDEHSKGPPEQDPQDLQRMLDQLAAYKYRYKNPDQPGAMPGNHVGVMAQDLERSPLGSSFVRDTPQGKMVDYGQMAGVQLAASAYLNERVNKLESMLGRSAKER